MKPVIGLTSYRQRGQTGVWDTEMAMLPAFYLEGVTRAGGIAVILPPQQIDSSDARNLLSGLDGLVITGGRDVESTRYGHEPHAQAEKPDRLRDLLEDEIDKIVGRVGRRGPSARTWSWRSSGCVDDTAGRAARSRRR